MLAPAFVLLALQAASAKGVAAAIEDAEAGGSAPQGVAPAAAQGAGPSAVQGATPGATPPAARAAAQSTAPDATREVLHPDRLSGWETRAGWRLLFDGASTAGWLGAKPGPRVVDGWLTASVPGTELVLAERIGNFELELRARSSSDAAAPEAFVRVIAKWPRLEVWDGARHHGPVVVPTDTEVTVGPITLRCPMIDLGPCEVALVPSEGRDAFRDVRVRALDDLPGTRVDLFDGRTLAGWRKIGDAQWSVEDGAIVGAVGGGAQSFLVTEKEYGDFILDVDLKNELPGNSGIQVRSHQSEKGRVFGYQIEIDPSARAWSGGFYDEGRRGWLDDLADDPLARAAFKPGEWNHYRIECVGPHVKTWVNGVKCVDALDPLDAEGFIGLQVHSGKDTRMRWKNFVLHDLGGAKWDPVELPESFDVSEPDSESARPFVMTAEEWSDGVLRLRGEPRRKGTRMFLRWRGESLLMRWAGEQPEARQMTEADASDLVPTPSGWIVALPKSSPRPGEPNQRDVEDLFVVMAGRRVKLLHGVRVIGESNDNRASGMGRILVEQDPYSPHVGRQRIELFGRRP